MANDIHSLAERLNIIIQEFQIPGKLVASVSSSGRLVVKKNNRTSTKTILEQALRKIGIVTLDSMAGNLKGYENDYKELRRRDGSILNKGDTVYFHHHRASVQGFRAFRNDAAILLPFRDFFIEADARKLSVTDSASTIQPERENKSARKNEEQTTSQPTATDDDCNDVREENTALRRELETCRSEVNQYKEENNFFREEYGELPEEITEEMPEIQREQIKEEITETVDKISTAYEQLDKQEAKKQEKHLKELVNEATKQGGSSTVHATADCIVRENHVHNGIEIVFPAEPDSSVKTELKKQSFKYHRRGKYWFAKKTDNRMKFATSLCSGNGEPITTATKTAISKKTAQPFEPPPADSVKDGVYLHVLNSNAKKVIQAKLRHIFPNVKITISSSGSSLAITAYDVSETDQDRIEDVVARFGQLGFDGMTDSTTYHSGEPFVEDDGTWHRYSIATYLFVRVKGKSSTDKTSPDYKKHFAVHSSIPPLSVNIRPPSSDTTYVHHLTMKEAVEKIPQKLQEMFPRMQFRADLFRNPYAHDTSEGKINIWVSQASSTDLERIETIARRFSDRSGTYNELQSKRSSTAFVEHGERHRYVAPCTILVMHARLVEEDLTYPEYIYHFSETYPMQSPTYIDVHETEEDFFPAPPNEKPKPKPEPRPQPEPKPEPEPIAPEPFPQPKPVQPETELDPTSLMSELKEALLSAIKAKQGAV